MKKYIDAEKLKAEIERFSATEYGDNTIGDDVANGALDYVLEEIIPSLQQEQPDKLKKNLNDAHIALTEMTNTVWHFKGCFGGQQKGKPVAEIDEVRGEETMDLEEEVKEYFQGLWPGTETAEQCNTDMHFTPPAILRMVEHFYRRGLNARK